MQWKRDDSGQIGQKITFDFIFFYVKMCVICRGEHENEVVIEMCYKCNVPFVALDLEVLIMSSAFNSEFVAPNLKKVIMGSRFNQKMDFTNIIEFKSSAYPFFIDNFRTTFEQHLHYLCTTLIN